MPLGNSLLEKPDKRIPPGVARFPVVLLVPYRSKHRVRIAPFARFAFREHEFAESGHHEFAVVLDFIAGQIGQLIEQFSHLRTLHAELVGEMVEHFGLRHAFLACFGRHFEV